MLVASPRLRTRREDETAHAVPIEVAWSRVGGGSACILLSLLRRSEDAVSCTWAAAFYVRELVAAAARRGYFVCQRGSRLLAIASATAASDVSWNLCGAVDCSECVLTGVPSGLCIL